MDPRTQKTFKERLTTVTLFLRYHVTQLTVRGNSQLLKYYARLRQSLHSYQEIILDEKGTILTWNRSFEKLEGYSEEEIIGQSFNLFYLPRDRQGKLPEQLLASASVEGKSRYFGVFVKKGGGTFWGNLVLTAIKKDNKQLLGYLVICREVIKDNFLPSPDLGIHI